MSQPLAVSSMKQALSTDPLVPNQLLPSSTCALSQEATWAQINSSQHLEKGCWLRMSLWDEETMVMLQGQKAIQRKSLRPFKGTTTALSFEQSAQKMPMLSLAVPSPGFPDGLDDKECLQCRRSRFDPWVGTIPWKERVVVVSSNGLRLLWTIFCP